jgi:two-component system response regulator ChvI
MPIIGLVDDDPETLTSVSLALEQDNYKVETYTDGHSALAGFRSSPPDLAILDIQLPGLDGMEILRRLRQTSHIPVMFLSSKDDEVIELLGLKMGADDVIRKPFSQRVLTERVKTVLKRVAADLGTYGKEDHAVIEYDQLRIDTARHVCTWKNQPVSFTATEFSMLRTLISRPGVVRSRQSLMDAVCNERNDIDDRAVDVHIKRIRKKLRVVDNSFDMIEALRGLGYRVKQA